MLPHYFIIVHHLYILLTEIQGEQFYVSHVLSNNNGLIKYNLVKFYEP